MASNWQDTYKKLKKRKELIDKLPALADTKQNENVYKPTNILSSKAPTTKTSSSKTTTKKKNSDRLFSAFDDGYDFGDISKTIVKGVKTLGTSVYETGKEFVKNPVQSLKTTGISIASGVNKADDAINSATDDFFDWIMKREDEDKGLTVKEYNRLVSSGTDEEKQQALQKIAKDYGEDSEEYKRYKEAFYAEDTRSDTIKAIDKIINPDYQETETYQNFLEGELSKGQQNIWGIGENIGNMIPSIAVSTITGNPTLGSAIFFTQAQQNYTDEAKAQGYSDKDARTYGLIMGGAESIVERLGFDQLGGLGKLSSGSIARNMAGEGLEEFVMPYIDSTVKSIGYDEEFDLESTTEEALEGAVMGAVTGAIMNAGGKGLKSVDSFITKVNTGQEITQNDFVNAGVELQEADPNAINEALEGVPNVLKQEALKNQEIENEQKSQNYQYVPQETDSIQRKTISEDASKYANNTKRTQELIDLVVNTSEASGINFRLANNEAEIIVNEKNKLIENYAKNNNVSMEEATERFKNTIIDAYNNGEIILNVDSSKALNRLVGHEVTHSLEGTQEYANLQKIAIEYAKTKGEYDTRVGDLQALYEGTNANIDNELTSDLVGDYLFSDQEFINRIHAEDRNLFQRVYDEIKHLYKMATAGSKEARQLEQLQHSFEKAMRENKTTSQQTEINLSTEQPVQIQDVLENKIELDEATTELTEEQAPLIEQKQTTMKSLEKELTKKLLEDQVTNRTTPSQEELDNLEDIRLNKSGSEYADAFYKLEKKYGKANLYKGLNSYKTTGKALESTKDNQSREVSKGMQEYMKESKVRDDSGNLLTMYHGTGSEFNIFDISKSGQHYEDGWSAYGEGIYFTPDKASAETFSKEAKGNNNNVKEVYLDVKNPFYANQDYKELFEQYGLEPFINTTGRDFITQINVRDGREASTKILKELGYDGIIETFGDKGINEVVVFNSNQIKNTDNTNPTSNDDIRYSLSESNQKRLEELKAIDTSNMGIFQRGAINKEIEALEKGYSSVEEYNKAKEVENQQRLEEYRKEKQQRILEAQAQEQATVKQGYTRLYRGLGNEYDPNYDRTKLDNNNGYESWTDSYELAKEYGGEVYYIDVPTSKIKNDVFNENSGERYLVYRNDKPVGLRGKSGTEYMLYTDHSDFKNIKYNKVVDTANLSLSNQDTDIAPTSADIFGSEIKLAQKQVSEQVQEAIAPLQETIQELNNKITTIQENIAPVSQQEVEQQGEKSFKAITDEDAPTVLEDTSPDVETTNEAVEDPFYDRDIKAVGNRKVKAYMYENPEVKPFFQAEARTMLGDLDNSIKGEKVWLQEWNPAEGMMEANMVTGTRRLTTSDIAELLDVYHYTYDQIRTGLNNIIEDNGKENNAVSKRIEFMLNDRLLKGYKSIDGYDIPANEEYKALLKNKNIQEYTEQAYQEWNNKINQDELVPIATEDVSNTNTEAQNVALENDLPFDDEVTRQVEKQLKEEPKNEPRIEREVKQEDPMAMFERSIDRQIGNEMTYTRSEPRVAKTKTQKLQDAWGKFQDQFVNRNYYIDKMARDTGNQQIKYAGDMLNNIAGEIDGDVFIAQTDNNGNAIAESLSSLFENAKNNGYYEAFNDYLMHFSNMDRHQFGKGSVVPLEYSRQMIAEYDKMYPTMRAEATKVWKYGKNLLGNMQSNGLISGQFNMTLQKMYPHYVPFMQNKEFTPFMSEDGTVKPKKAIKRAYGGADEILEIEEAFTKYTYATKKAVRQNELYKEIVNTSNEKISIGADDRLDPTNLEKGLGVDENGKYYVTAYENGEMKQAVISEDLYNELTKDAENRVKALEERYELVTKPLQKVSNLRRNLLTTYSPTFLATNFLKDVQDGLLNSKYTKDFIKNYPTAFTELARAKTPLSKQFLTLYGSGNIMGEYNSNSITQNTNAKNGKFLRNMVNKVSKFNNIVELAPRYAEFKASIEHGASIQEAMYNAREVTTNFGRGGYITKAVNRNGFTFLNSSVQGFDKLVRNFSGENGARGVVNSLSKVAVYAIAPSVINALAFGAGTDDEDEDYTALPDYIKDNYYLFKTGDGEFIRIPKGRMISVFGSAGRRTLELLKGKEDAFEGYLTNAYSQVGVQNPLESNIFAPIIQAFGSENGKTWYGTDLVPTRLQDVPVEEQYDESTDEFSKWLGEKIGVSPYKLNYVIDQYSGGIGDLILPTITEEATSDGSFLAPIKDKFTANTTFDNKYVSEFYSTKDEMEVQANGSKATDEDLLKSKYLTSVSFEMSELYKEKREVQSNSDLTKQEKYRRVQNIQEQINSLAEEGLNGYEKVNKTSNYAIVNDKEYYKNANDEWWNPDEEELEEINSLGMDIDDKSAYFEAKNGIYEVNQKYQGTEDTYEDRKRDIIDVVRYSNLNEDYKSYLYGKYYSEDTTAIVNTLGIDFDAYLDYESQYFTADKDEAGKSISGSKKKKVFDYINSMDIGFEEKAILAKLEYNAYDEWNHEIIDYLNQSSITYDEMVFILKKMGFVVDNEGNIYWD